MKCGGRLERLQVLHVDGGDSGRHRALHVNIFVAGVLVRVVLARVGDEVLVAREHLSAGYTSHAALRTVYADVTTQVS